MIEPTPDKPGSNEPAPTDRVREPERPAGRSDDGRSGDASSTNASPDADTRRADAPAPDARATTAPADGSSAESTEHVESADPRDKRRKKKRKPPPTGSPKSIETMYRNAYRAELDMIALAATKANIMISLNGFIISVLMVSGGFIYASSPVFLLPATVFLFTSAISVYFALLAASPEQLGKLGRAMEWARAVVAREARLRDFRQYIQREEEFVDGKSNVLIYEDRAKLSRSQYRKRMRKLRGNTDQVYDRMSDQLYWLGQMASTKFRMLGVSHGVFRYGLVLSVVAFLSVKSIDALLVLDGGRVVQLRNVGVLRFDDIYEPSASAQLSDGRVLIAEDESERALNLLSFRADGSLAETPDLDGELTASLGRELSDLEGLAIDPDDYIYAITSHSRTESGKRKPAREELVRFRIRGETSDDIGFHSTLRTDLAESSVLRDALAARAGRTIEIDDINIEGLAFDTTGESLLVGFREPTVDGLSLVVTIANPDAMFERGASPEFTGVALLDLQGGGVRSMNFDPVLDTYLLVNEVRVDGGEFRPRLWSWSGNPEDVPEEMYLPGMIDLKNVESVDSITVNRNSRLLISSDDGNAKEGRPATYMLLEHDQLWRSDTADADSR